MKSDSSSPESHQSNPVAEAFDRLEGVFKASQRTNANREEPENERVEAALYDEGGTKTLDVFISVPNRPKSAPAIQLCRYAEVDPHWYSDTVHVTLTSTGSQLVVDSPDGYGHQELELSPRGVSRIEGHVRWALADPEQ